MLPNYRFPLDPTGVNRDNAVNGEVHQMTNSAIRAVAPVYGGYFTDSLKVYDHQTGRLLDRDVDYQCVELLQDATMRYGKEICVMILVINQTVTSQVRLNYQVVGGEFQYDGSAIINLYETAMADNRPIDWANVSNKPQDYPPSLHRHLLEDVYGFEPVVAALERLRSAVILSDVPAFEALIDWTTVQMKAVTDTVDARTVVWQQHVDMPGNPHNTKKADLGLDKVENLPVLNQYEATQNTPVNKYVTYDRLLEVLARKGI